jgi:hypothetical protein
MRVGRCLLLSFHGPLPVGVDTAAGLSTQLTASALQTVSADRSTPTEPRGPAPTGLEYAD